MEKPPLGRKIQDGGHRYIYEHGEDDNLVVKIPIDDRHNKRNIEEGRVWEYAKKYRLQDWLAEVVDYCPDGEWLIMEKAKPIGSKRGNLIPNSRPMWFDDDEHSKNWGYVERDGEKLLVILDYGMPRIMKTMRIGLRQGKQYKKTKKKGKPSKGCGCNDK